MKSKNLEQTVEQLQKEKKKLEEELEAEKETFGQQQILSLLDREKSDSEIESIKNIQESPDR